MAEEEEIALAAPGLGTDARFARMEGFDAISAPFAFTLVIATPKLELAAADVLGTEVLITLNGTPPRHFHGIAADFGLAEIRSDMAYFRLTLRPWLWFLGLRRNNRIFQNLSVVEIIEQVFADHRGAAFVKRLQGTYPPREYCVQYDESDLDFVQRLMEHEGIFYFFEHGEGGHELVLTDRNAALTPGPQTDEVIYTEPGRSGIGHGNHIFAWQPKTQVRPGSHAHTDYDFEKPAADLMSRSDAPLGHAQDAAESYGYPGDYTQQRRGETLSALRLEELQAPHRRILARGTARQLWSGRRFRLAEFPRAAENDDYLVLRADYTLWHAQERAGQPVEVRDYEVGLQLAPLSLPFRPERRTPRPVMKGVQTAVVVGPAGEEIYTDAYARVKVQFHWDRLGKKDENTTCFVRVSSAWAGAGWGFIQIPRIGQEVIVDFLDGNPDAPIITGRVYNAAQMPPYGLPGTATQSGWKSNSSPGGGGWNELRFEDKAGAEEVYFQAQKDHNELVKNNESRQIGNDFAEDVGHDAQQSIGHDRTESVGHDKAVSVGNNRTVDIGVNDTETVGSNRSLSVGANETISVGSNSSETIGANHSQTVAVTQTITVGAARADTVGGPEVRSVGASQTNTIGASRSVTVGSGQTHSIGSDDGWTVGGGQTVSIAKDQSFTVGGGQSTTVGKDQTNKVAGTQASEIGKDMAMKVAGAMALKVGKTFVLDAADSIVLKTGSAAITMKKDGTITIEGKDITIKGSGKIDVKASSDVTIKGSKIKNN